MIRIFVLGLLFCAITLNAFAKNWKTASEELVRRVVKARASEFCVEAIPAAEGRMCSKLKAGRGKWCCGGTIRWQWLLL